MNNLTPSPRHCILFVSFFFCSAFFLFSTPSLVIDKTEFIFDAVVQGADVTGSVALKNEGAAALTVSAQPSCLCLRVTSGSITIPPYGIQYFMFSLDTTEYSGPVQFDILLESNDPVHRHTWISLKGNIVQPDSAKGKTGILQEETITPKTGFTAEDAGRTDQVAFLSYSNCQSCLKTWASLKAWAISKNIIPAFYPLEQAKNKESLFLLCSSLGSFPELPIAMTQGNILAGHAQINEYIAGKEPEEVKPTGLHVIAVFAAGLLDGINPCAFTLIILLVSYLSLQLQRRKTILATGLIYIATVFITYFFIGAGLFEFIRVLDGFSAARTVLKYLITAVLIILAVLSLYDFAKTLRNKTKEMILKLPKRLDKLVRKIIRNRMKNYKIIFGAIILGFLVSLIELACTGQVYFPVIGYIVRSNPAQGVFYLAIYNTGFIIPLLAVFILVYTGISSKTIGDLFGKHVAKVKIAFAVFFIFLAVVNLFF